jgi:hypothetical protein
MAAGLKGGRVDAVPAGETPPFRVEPFSVRVDAAVLVDLRADPECPAARGGSRLQITV